MKGRLPVLFLVGACSPSKALVDGNAAALAPPDAGIMRADAASAGPADCSDNGDAGGILDTGPPAGGPSISPGPAPSSEQQSAVWVPTGAPGCEDLVPAGVPPRLSWSAPGEYCFEGPPVVDGQGDLAFAFDELWPDTNTHAFFPADGGAGQLVRGSAAYQPLDLVGRPKGFFMNSYAQSSLGAWVSAFGPDGSDQGYVRAVDRQLDELLWPDPRGGFVEGHVSYDQCARMRSFQVRWVDEALAPRTPWRPVLSWTYWNFYPNVYIDVFGNALVLVMKDYPLTQPCYGADTVGFWISESGSVVPFAPATSIYPTDICGDDNFAGFGTAVTLDDGGFAFYLPPNPRVSFSLSGWYARYPSGSGIASAPPPWLQDYDGSIQRIAGGRAYLGTRRDPESCARTAAIVSPSGQVCATVGLDGSADCEATDRISADGTLVLGRSASCTATWWPGLGRLR